MRGLLTSREKDLILVKKDFLVRSMRSSSASSPSIIAQLSAVGSSHSLPPEVIISLEYLYCSLQMGDNRNSTLFSVLSLMYLTVWMCQLFYKHYRKYRV